MAQRLMQVARHPVLSDATRVSQLPAAMGTRVVLAGLDEDQTTAAIESGEIQPGMTRTSAVALVRRRRPRLTPAQREVVWGAQGRIRDPATDALLGAASLVHRALRYRGEHGIRFPDAEPKALDEIGQVLADYRREAS
jgi:hypothetical protein